MKNALIALALVFTVGQASAQSGLELTSALTLAPFATATKLIESGVVTMLSPFAITSASVQGRGVAGKEQLKDELVSLNEDMIAGKVKVIADVRQPALRELFEEMVVDEKQMNEINSIVKTGTNVHKMATAVALTLMLE